MASLLILRPEPGARRTLARAAALGLDARSLPLFEVVALPWEAPDPADFDALLLTSANAVRQADLARYHSLPVHAVGAATAQAALDAGFADVQTGPGDVASLLASLTPPLRLLHPCGADRRDAEASGIAIVHMPVYASRLADPAGLDDALAEAPVVLLHSPRAAARFAALVADREELRLAAISAAAAQAAGTGWRAVAIATTPDDQALLAIAARLCEESTKARGTA